MLAESEKIVEAALKLPEEERLAIAARLMETVADDAATLALDDPDLIAELNRRFASLDGAIAWSSLRSE